MDAAELRAMQAPIKERYKSDPSAAVITLKAKGSIDNEGIACKVETGRALAVAGLHPATGGSGLELCSGDMLLEALVACAGVTHGPPAVRRRSGHSSIAPETNATTKSRRLLRTKSTEAVIIMNRDAQARAPAPRRVGLEP